MGTSAALCCSHWAESLSWSRWTTFHGLAMVVIPENPNNFRLVVGLQLCSPHKIPDSEIKGLDQWTLQSVMLLLNILLRRGTVWLAINQFCLSPFCSSCKHYFGETHSYNLLRNLIRSIDDLIYKIIAAVLTKTENVDDYDIHLICIRSSTDNLIYLHCLN